MPETRYIAQPAAQVTDDARQRVDQPLRDAGVAHQEPEYDEQRNGEQDQTRNALIHPVDNGTQRNRRRQRQIAQRPESKRERDRNTDRYARADEQHEK
jgi:hypothetical protein